MAWPETVRKADLRIEFYRGSGPGGQHRNKRDIACRITHKPTGLAATAEDQRSQSTNRRLAFERLVVKLVPLMKAAARRTPEAVERIKERFRTYHAVRGTVTDNRLPGETWSFDDVLNGDLDPIIEKLQRRK
jgi:protein subunit release factor A